MYNCITLQLSVSLKLCQNKKLKVKEVLYHKKEMNDKLDYFKIRNFLKDSIKSEMQVVELEKRIATSIFDKGLVAGI